MRIAGGSRCGSICVFQLQYPSAAERGHLDVVRYLCELPPDRGVDPSADGNYAVRYAAEKGHLNIVRYLCDLPFSRGVARVLSEQPTPCRFGSDGNAARAWSLLPRSAFGDLRQQALASSARLPLLMLRALVRQHRATRNGRKVQSSRERSATCLELQCRMRCGPTKHGCGGASAACA